MLQSILDVVLAPPRPTTTYSDSTNPTKDEESAALAKLPFDAASIGMFDSDGSWFDQLDFSSEFWSNIGDQNLTADTSV